MKINKMFYKPELSKKIFSGGEIHTVLKPHEFDRERLRFDLHSSDDIMSMLLFVNAIKSKKVEVYIPYIPYGRADRVMPNGGGDALGIKVMADLINSCGFEKVYTLDTHSPVTDALINNISVIKPIELIRDALDGKNGTNSCITFVAPDIGAEKKVSYYAKCFGVNLVCARKKRNTDTGEIVETELLDKIPDYHLVYVIDDICDGGKTFIELAKVLPKKCEPTLIVTHGIFSKGVDELLSYYKEIYASDSFPKPENRKVKQITIL